jgi:hypothetical protein
MTATRLLLILAAVWVACIVLGGLLHIIRFLVYVALVATAVVVLVGAFRRRA